MFLRHLVAKDINKCATNNMILGKHRSAL